MEKFVLIGGLIINFLMMVFLAFQTRHISRQTRTLTRSLEYSTYLKLVDYLNEVSNLLIQDPKVKSIFEEMKFIKDGLAEKGLTTEKVGLAWLIINRYEAAYMGEQLGVLPDGEWQVWKERLRNDLRLKFVRDVWENDVRSFDYNRGFAKLMNEVKGVDT
ncbi:MAG TPA: hypothetical protein VH988_32695 [Thermoanaerobaculia bacterium]|nr:hypothetical protein [Thermoanaerobaculia bacterium]